MNEQRRLSDIEVEERAATALATLNDPFFQDIFDEIRQDFLNQLISAPIGSPEAVSAHAGIQMVDKFKAALQSAVTEKKMRAKRRVIHAGN